METTKRIVQLPTQQRDTGWALLSDEVTLAEQVLKRSLQGSTYFPVILSVKGVDSLFYSNSFPDYSFMVLHYPSYLWLAYLGQRTVEGGTESSTYGSRVFKTLYISDEILKPEEPGDTEKSETNLTWEESFPFLCQRYYR